MWAQWKTSSSLQYIRNQILKSNNIFCVIVLIIPYQINMADEY